MMPFGLKHKKYRKYVGGFISMALVTLVGNMFLFSSFFSFKDALLLIYIFSDSRFFLFSTIVILISLGPIFKINWTETGNQIKQTATKKITSGSNKRNFQIFIVIVVGFTPSILAIPSGLGLIDYDTRYGWDGIEDLVYQIGDENSIFLVDRANEFTWRTERMATFLKPLSGNYSVGQHLQSIYSQAVLFEADYFLLDVFTTTRWVEIRDLMDYPMNLNSGILLQTSVIRSINRGTLTLEAPSAILVSEDNDNQPLKLFEIQTSSFAREWDGSQNSTGWETGDNAHIVDDSRGISLTLNVSSSVAYVNRTQSNHLNLTLSGGFFFTRISENNAVVTHIEILDTDGNLISVCERYRDDVFYVPLGDVTVGNIVVFCSGSEEGTVLFHQMSLWSMNL
jgi:hypothetical protein